MIVTLTQGKVAIVDDADSLLVAGHHWTAFSNGGIWYARFHEGRTTGLLHRVILGADAGARVDHINGDGLDCRRSNLRPASKIENARNGAIRRNNTSGITGVCAIPDGRWRAYINLPGHRQIALGLYSDIENATKARHAAELKYFGAFAPHVCRGVA